MSKKRGRRPTSPPKQQPKSKQKTTGSVVQKTENVLVNALPLSSQNPYLVLFLLNIIVAILWPLILPLFEIFDYLIGFVVGFAALTLLHRPYARRAYYLVYFIGYVLWEIVLSNLSIAKLVIQPKPKLDPGIIAIPLSVSSGLEITILASVITLTPGTISVDLGDNAEGERVLYVHNLTVGDPETFRQSVKEGFERLLLRATRGDLMTGVE